MRRSAGEQRSGLISLHSSVRSTEGNSSEHFCTAQQSAFLYWSRPAGALLCWNPIRTFHICGPRGWMGLPAKPATCGRLSFVAEADSASLFHAWMPVVTAISLNTEGLGCLSVFATVQACLHPLALRTSKTRCKTYYIAWVFTDTIAATAMESGTHTADAIDLRS